MQTVFWFGFFKSSFKSYNKMERNVWTFPIYPLCPIPMCTQPPHCHVPPPRGLCVSVAEPILLNCYPGNKLYTPGFTLGIGCWGSLDSCVRTGVLPHPTECSPASGPPCCLLSLDPFSISHLFALQPSYPVERVREEARAGPESASAAVIAKKQPRIRELPRVPKHHRMLVFPPPQGL